MTAAAYLSSRKAPELYYTYPSAAYLGHGIAVTQVKLKRKLPTNYSLDIGQHLT